jgi:mono/diheme cytochrome c family protein
MRFIHYDLMPTIVPVVVAGSMSLVLYSFLYAQDYPADSTRGKAVYQRNCQACHGVGGWGDGPDAQALKVAPANFHRFSSFLKSDEELLRTIEHGVVFSPMHSWRGQLTDGEMQDVVSYLSVSPQAKLKSYLSIVLLRRPSQR